MSVEAILKQYEENNKKKSKAPKMTEEERLNQYFSTFLPKGVNSATKRVRILPADEGQSSPFTQVYGHKAQVNGQWRTFICPKHEADDHCPFCEAREGLLASGIDSDRKLAGSYSARLMYVVKVIDRAHEDQGVKFWRFNHDGRMTGVFDKIIGVITAIKDSAAPDFTDPVNGRDLIINIARDQNGNATVNSVVNSDPSPLHADEAIANSWIEESKSKSWQDVYSIKPYTYLEIIVKGGEPVWKRNEDGEGGQWVDKEALNAMNSDSSINDDDDELIAGSNSTTEDAVATPTSTMVTSSDEEEDDLPF